MTRVRARLFGLVLVAAMLASSTGFARVQFLCRMSGLVGDPCCCARHEKKSDASVAELRETNCCQAIVGKSADRAAFEPPTGIRIPPPGLVVSTELAAPPVPAVALELPRTIRSRGPPANGPPLYIKHCTLLG